MPQNNVKSFYENFYFESMITNPPKLIQDFLDGEIKFIREHIKPNKTVLEVGSGYGRLLSVLSEKAAKVVGIDFSKRMVKLAKERLADKKNVEICLMDANRLNFEENTFDYVVCLDNSFGNMPNIELDVLKEMVKVCKIGGEVIISVFSENASPVQIENYQRIGLTNITDDGTAIHTQEGFYSRRFTKQELTELFDKCRLECKIIKICTVNYVAYVIKN